MVSPSLGRRFFLTGSAACLATRATAHTAGPVIPPPCLFPTVKAAFWTGSFRSPSPKSILNTGIQVKNSPVNFTGTGTTTEPYAVWNGSSAIGGKEIGSILCPPLLEPCPSDSRLSTQPNAGCTFCLSNSNDQQDTSRCFTPQPAHLQSCLYGR